MPQRFCAHLLRSKFFSSVFDVNDQDMIGKSFNIFVDTELSELNQIIQIAALGELGVRKKQKSFSRSHTAKKSNSALIDLP